MNVRSRFAALSFALFSVSASTTTVTAQDARCFGSANSQAVVGIGDNVTLDPTCQYSLSREGAWERAPAELLGHPVGFLEVYERLRGQGSTASDDERPRFVYGRPPAGRRAAIASDQTLVLRFCTHYLMEEELAFRLRSGQELVIERAPAANCGGAGLELRAVALEGDGRGRMLFSGTPTHVLGTGTPALQLTHGSWAFYAAAPGSRVGVRVGQLSSRAAQTPLRAHFRAAGTDEPPAPLMEATWSAGGADGLALRSITVTPSLWSELRTAAAANLLWLVERGPDDSSPGRVIESLHIQAAGDLARLPDAIVADFMAGRYGDAGAAMAPTAGEWTTLLGKLDLCVAPSYRTPMQVERGAQVPADSHCASLLRIASVAQAGATIPQVGGSLCVERGMMVMGADGATRVGAEETCIPVGAGESSGAAHVLFAVRGDRARLRDVPADSTCLMLDNEPLDAPVQGELVTLDRPGLLEVRAGSRQSGCASRQALTLARLAVVDPERQWHPVGLLTREPEDPEHPFANLSHDETTVFAFNDVRQSLDTRLSVSPVVAAAINADPSIQTEVTQNVPVIGGVLGTFAGARPPAVVAYLSRDAECPTETAGELSERLPLDPTTVPVEARFHVLLATVEGADRPLHCIARATFRVRSSRVFATVTADDWLRIEAGLLGDFRALVFPTKPAALGFGLPVVYLRIAPFEWLAVDMAAALVTAGGFSPDEINRTGLGLWMALEGGIPNWAPRLLTAGAMLHVAPNTYSTGEPRVSFFVGLNLSSLVDLAGGR